MKNPSCSAYEVRTVIIELTYLSDDSSHELEVADMVWVDVTLGTWLVGSPTGRRDEQSVTRVEYFSRQEVEPFSTHSACVFSLLSSERHVEFSLNTS